MGIDTGGIEVGDMGIDTGGIDISVSVGTVGATVVVVVIFGACIAAAICSKLRSFVK